MNKKIRFLFMSVLLYIPVVASSRAGERPVMPTDHSDSVTIHKVNAEVFPSYVFNTAPFFAGENAAGKPIDATLSTHLKYSFKLGKNTDLGRIYPNTFQGIGLAWNTFFNKKEVGIPTALYLFQNSRIATLAPNLYLNYEWNFGITYGWNKYDEEHNPKNTVVGSKANAYINLGILLDWEFAPMWNLTAGIGLTHFSNGNTRYPNAGVNSIGGRIGVSRSFEGPGRKEKKEDLKFSDSNFISHHETKFRRHMTYDLIVYGASRKKAINIDTEPFIVPGDFGIIGVNFSPMYNVSRYFRAGVSADFQFDESANIEAHIPEGTIIGEEMKFYRPPFIERGSFGLSARVELVMPFFSINIGLGRNIICRGKDTDGWYNIFALKADLWHDCFLHIGYQLYNFKNPNNLMLGIGYRFNNGRNKARR